MIDSIITSKARVKLLMKLFLNSNNQAHLRGIAKELNESTNAIHRELNRLFEANLLTDEYLDNRRIFKANTQHPLFENINHILQLTVGIDKIVNHVTMQIRNLDAAYIVGSFAAGVESDTIELLITGKDLDRQYIEHLVSRVEKMINKRIVLLIISASQMEYFFKDNPILLIWTSDSKKAR